MFKEILIERGGGGGGGASRTKSRLRPPGTPSREVGLVELGALGRSPAKLQLRPHRPRAPRGLRPPSGVAWRTKGAGGRAMPPASPAPPAPPAPPLFSPHYVLSLQFNDIVSEIWVFDHFIFALKNFEFLF